MSFRKTKLVFLIQINQFEVLQKIWIKKILDSKENAQLVVYNLFIFSILFFFSVIFTWNWQVIEEDAYTINL